MKIHDYFLALTNCEYITNQEAHIAMGLLLNKTWEQLHGMYAPSLSAALSRLRTHNIVKNIGYRKWEINRNISEWSKDDHKNEKKVAETKGEKKSTDELATLELLAFLEKQISDLKNNLKTNGTRQNAQTNKGSV